jgi:hypothetical protein
LYCIFKERCCRGSEEVRIIQIKITSSICIQACFFDNPGLPQPLAEAARGGALYRPSKNRQHFFEDFMNISLKICARHQEGRKTVQ